MTINQVIADMDDDAVVSDDDIYGDLDADIFAAPLKKPRLDVSKANRLTLNFNSSHFCSASLFPVCSIYYCRKIYSQRSTKI